MTATACDCGGMGLGLGGFHYEGAEGCLRPYAAKGDEVRSALRATLALLSLLGFGAQPKPVDPAEMMGWSAFREGQGDPEHVGSRLRLRQLIERAIVTDARERLDRVFDPGLPGSQFTFPTGGNYFVTVPAGATITLDANTKARKEGGPSSASSGDRASSADGDIPAEPGEPPSDPLGDRT